MAAVTVGDIFEDERTMAVNGVLFTVLDSGFDGEDVHTVNLEAGNVLATFIVVC